MIFRCIAALSSARAIIRPMSLTMRKTGTPCTDFLSSKRMEVHCD